VEWPPGGYLGAPRVPMFGAVADRILVVDDEPDLLELVRFNLCQLGYEVETATGGREGLEKARRQRPDLVVLDVMLPDLPGTEVCRRLRSDPDLASLPILMLTARSEEIDRVVGLEVGADDYVTKPFSPRELGLRAQAILRRVRGGREAPVVLRNGRLELDTERHRCRVEGEEVRLTAKEFELLRTLMERPGRVMSRDRLLDQVWGSDITVTSRTIDTHLKRLREKLGAAGDLVETVRGVGYRFAD
jgi:two-component system phosphate regulon response regulator PhoB